MSFCFERHITSFPIFFPLYPFHVAGGEDSEARERDEIRHDRRRDRQHDRNISRAAPDKRCCTRTLNTAHMNSSNPHFATFSHTHTGAESFMELTEQSMAGSSKLLRNSLCLSAVISWRYLYVHSGRLSLVLVSGGVEIQRGARYNHHSSCQTWLSLT